MSDGDFFDAVGDTKPGGIVQGGHYKTTAEKGEAFSGRIVSSIVKACGAEGGFVHKVIKPEAERRGWCEWLNNETSFPWAVEACRIFNFNFFDLMFKSKIDKHPLAAMWMEHSDNWPDHDLVFVFRVAVYGDLVMTNYSRSDERPTEMGFWLNRSSSAVRPFEVWTFKEFLNVAAARWQFS